jgi:hypothetical protein
VYTGICVCSVLEDAMYLLLFCVCVCVCVWCVCVCVCVSAMNNESKYYGNSRAQAAQLRDDPMDGTGCVKGKA